MKVFSFSCRGEARFAQREGEAVFPGKGCLSGQDDAELEVDDWCVANAPYVKVVLEFVSHWFGMILNGLFSGLTE
jgi:hypothetical protein